MFLDPFDYLRRFNRHEANTGKVEVEQNQTMVAALNAQSEGVLSFVFEGTDHMLLHVTHKIATSTFTTTRFPGSNFLFFLSF